MRRREDTQTEADTVLLGAVTRTSPAPAGACSPPRLALRHSLQTLTPRIAPPCRPAAPSSPSHSARRHTHQRGTPLRSPEADVEELCPYAELAVLRAWATPPPQGSPKYTAAPRAILLAKRASAPSSLCQCRSPSSPPAMQGTARDAAPSHPRRAKKLQGERVQTAPQPPHAEARPGRCAPP